MSLAKLLIGIGISWVILGSLVLGPSLLIYPAAWMTILAFFFGLHQIVGGKLTTTKSVEGTASKPESFHSGGLPAAE